MFQGHSRLPSLAGFCKPSQWDTAVLMGLVQGPEKANGEGATIYRLIHKVPREIPQFADVCLMK